MKTRAPGKDTIPSPRDGERVCFVDFLPRGFGFPLHPFLRGLLYVYGIQIHDLTPNDILSIASFFVLCERFVGISMSEVNVDCPVTPYGANNQLPEVIFFSSLQLQLYCY